MSHDKKWSLPEQPPPPLFLGEKERNLTKQLNDEISERILGQTIIYIPIDKERTNFHPLYGEAIEKNFLNPIRVYALVEWEGKETNTTSIVDTNINITVNFHKKRITEDQDLFVRVGDFIYYSQTFFEIVKLAEPRLLFGQQCHKFEITATCISSRKGLFEPFSMNME